MINLGHSFWWQPTEEEIEGNFVFCLLVLALNGVFIYPVAEAILTQY